MEETLCFARALADATRLRVINALTQHELCVCELCDALEISQSTLSTHLTVLREGRVVDVRKEGKWVYYALAPRLQRLTESILDRFKGFAKDRRVRRDSARIQKRIKLREHGCCVRGFDQLGNSRRAEAA